MKKLELCGDCACFYLASDGVRVVRSDGKRIGECRRYPPTERRFAVGVSDAWPHVDGGEVGCLEFIDEESAGLIGQLRKRVSQEMRLFSPSCDEKLPVVRLTSASCDEKLQVLLSSEQGSGLQGAKAVSSDPVSLPRRGPGRPKGSGRK